MIIGVDIDGVLADFNSSFIERVIRVTGHDGFPPRPFDIPTWNYPQHYGYTEAEVSAVWANIKADTTFWQNLPAYPDATEALKRLFALQLAGNDVYFITARPGAAAKVQSQRWLRRHGFPEPTVLLSSHKDHAAIALDLDAYVDDRWENALGVAGFINLLGTWQSSDTETYLVDRPWNTRNQDRGEPKQFGIITVPNAISFVNALSGTALTVALQEVR